VYFINKNAPSDCFFGDFAHGVDRYQFLFECNEAKNRNHF